MNDKLSSSVIRLKSDSVFAVVEGGVHLRNNRASYFVKGRSAYELIHLLFKLIDGTRTVEDICSGLKEEKRLAVEKQIRMLLESGLAREVLVAPTEVPSWCKKLYGDQLDFLDNIFDDSFSRFINFRSQRVLCIGSGRLLRSMLFSLIEYGAGNIHVAQIGEVHEDAYAIEKIVQAARDRDSQIQITIVMNGLDILTDKSVKFAYDYVVVAYNKTNWREINQIYDISIQHKATFTAISPVGGFVFATPLITPQMQICWECLYRSLFVSGIYSEQIAPAPVALACNQVTHNLFCHYTGVQHKPSGMVTTVECDSLIVRHHRANRHPTCPRHLPLKMIILEQDESGLIRPDIPSSSDPSTVTDAQNLIALKTSGLADPLVGPLLSVGEDDLAQLPFAASRCVVLSVSSYPQHLISHTIFCLGLSARETRNQVVLFALESLAKEIARETSLLSTTISTHLLDHNFSSMDCIGAGWTLGEAKYRALCYASLEWVKQTKFGGSEENILLEKIQMHPIGSYLINVLEFSSVTLSKMMMSMAPTGLLVAQTYSSNGLIGLGTGINEFQSCINAIADLAYKAANIDLLELGDSYSAHLTFQHGTWHEVLIRAEANRAESAYHYEFSDASNLMPSCGGHVCMVLLTVQKR